MIARKACLLSTAVVALVITIGCNVEERLWWSPDGSRAALLTPAGLCLVDTNGALSAPLASNVVSAAWLPDGRGLVLLRQITATNWNDITRLLPRAETEPAESLAKGLPGIFQAIRVVLGDNLQTASEKVFDKFPNLIKSEQGQFITAALLCLRDTQPAALQQAMANFSDSGNWQKEAAKLEANVFELSLLRLDGNQSAGPPILLERTLMSLEQPRPSPSAPAVAFRRGDLLMVAPLDGGTNRVSVTEKVEGYFDWTPDGKSLAYAARLAEKWESSTVNLCRIERCTVLKGDGGLVTGEPIPMAMAASVVPPRVRCLPDGRMLFASLAVRLPAAVDANQEPRLYLVDSSSGTNAPVELSTPLKALPAELAHFAPSPDGRQIAIVESGSDVVAVLDVATGSVEVVSSKRGRQCRTLPSWRGPNELYFAALPESASTRAEIFRWRKGAAPEVFSWSWPPEVVESLVDKPNK